MYYSYIIIYTILIFSVLFPGGATYLNNSNGYADAAQHIYEIAKELNNAGDYFPIFGTCLGFELMIILASGRSREDIRVSCSSYSNRQLHFVPGIFFFDKRILVSSTFVFHFHPNYIIFLVER